MRRVNREVEAGHVSSTCLPACPSVCLSVCLSVLASLCHLCRHSSCMHVVIELFTKRHKSRCRLLSSSSYWPLKPTVMISNLQLIGLLLLLPASRHRRLLQKFLGQRLQKRLVPGDFFCNRRKPIAISASS